MARLIEWDAIEVRISGEKMNEIARSVRLPPIESLQLRFSNGSMRVEGTIRKFITVPFAVEIGEILASGTTIRVPVKSASAFGAIPIPRFLFSLAQGQLPRDLVRYEEPATFVIALDRFLPNFVTADVQQIWIIDGGLAVTLGRGGADLPPSAASGMRHPASEETR
ncbi:MAG TPA: hypothetical protein VGR95_23440 [Thermoanaerobaculia bacterium]|jgi:hypothetical protein|nr:hypothetical protein [Thermoanaerobaculia bacterium]